MLGLLHTQTKAHLEEATPEFIKKDEWSPQGPNCYPMDYAIRDSLKDKVYQGVRDKLIKPALKRHNNYPLGGDISGKNMYKHFC